MKLTHPLLRMMAVRMKDEAVEKHSSKLTGNEVENEIVLRQLYDTAFNSACELCELEKLHKQQYDQRRD
jgi:hypothetical protein